MQDKIKTWNYNVLVKDHLAIATEFKTFFTDLVKEFQHLFTSHESVSCQVNDCLLKKLLIQK